MSVSMAVNKTLSRGTHPSNEITLRIQPSRSFFKLDLAAVWEYRELLYFLAWRDVKVRYKQTIIGAAWAILQPLMTMIIFTVVFGKSANLPSDGLPYSIFSYAALMPWNYFSQAITRGGMSLVGEANLIVKVYFPRLIVPIAAVVSPLIDFFLSFLVLIVMIAWFGIVPGWNVLCLPVFLLLALMTGLAVVLWLSPLNVRYRDVGHTIPFLTQFWLYASPVAYPVNFEPGKLHLRTGLDYTGRGIVAFLLVLTGTDYPAFGVMAVSAAVVVVLLLGGIVFFKRMERTFADVI